MDVLWFRLSRNNSDSADTFGHFDAGRIMVMLDRGDYSAMRLRHSQGRHRAHEAEGLEAFRGGSSKCRRFCPTAVGELKSWDDVKLLSVTVDRLRKWWRPGLDLHWRRGARHVADRGRGHQHGGAGRGGRREPACGPLRAAAGDGR